MQLEFTHNAQTRMAERGIGEADVQAVLEAPDHLSPFQEKHWHARKKVEKGTLEVIFSRDRLHVVVFTAFWKDLS
ncbi:MAG TPA: DUF4258 domain-containing protein [Candidatus Baltobacteraceae bacterium]|nr:DUF4258 domain-containing protein [Candidatus Baltobacteraceae bacterium]